MGLRVALDNLYDHYSKLLFVVEDGIEIDQPVEDRIVHDDYHIDYLRQHLSTMEEDGVVGYTAWGCVDRSVLGLAK